MGGVSPFCCTSVLDKPISAGYAAFFNFLPVHQIQLYLPATPDHINVARRPVNHLGLKPAKNVHINPYTTGVGRCYWMEGYAHHICRTIIKKSGIHLFRTLPLLLCSLVVAQKSRP